MNNPIDLTPKPFDHTAAFEAHLRPALEGIAALMQSIGINGVMVFDVSSPDGVQMTTAHMHSISNGNISNLIGIVMRLNTEPKMLDLVASITNYLEVTINERLQHKSSAIN